MNGRGSTQRLTHVDGTGRATMVDVGDKSARDRRASARVEVHTTPSVARQVVDHAIVKGDVIATCRIAGIQAAKRTSDLVPLAHQVPLAHVDVDVDVDVDSGVATIVTTARTTSGTGVEIEALVAASVAAVTFYDMIKGVDRSAVIEGLRVTAKSGGSSGSFVLDSERGALVHSSEQTP